MDPSNSTKQPTLKPHDLFVALKVAVNPERAPLLTTLATELSMALSVVHGSVTRAEQARLLSRSSGSLRAVPGALREFLSFGAKYAYPGVLGTLTRGMPTAISSPALRDRFHTTGAAQAVWPHPSGEAFGLALPPLHGSVPAACAEDAKLYEILSLFDAIRVGAARERELAVNAIAERLP